jgi:hypothetical protein
MATQTIKERWAEKASSVRALVLVLCVVTVCVLVVFRPWTEGAFQLFRDLALMFASAYIGRSRVSPANGSSEAGNGGSK